MNGALIVDGGESAKQIDDDANKNMVTRNLFIDSSQSQRGLWKKWKLKTIPSLREAVWVDFEPNRGDPSHHLSRRIGRCERFDQGYRSATQVAARGSVAAAGKTS